MDLLERAAAKQTGGDRTGPEMSADPGFAGRIRRLALVSSVALGVIAFLAHDIVGWSWGAAVMIGLGWLSMPTVLAASLRWPRLRYLLAVPSTLVLAGVLTTATFADVTAPARSGWWMIAAGIAVGGVLGMWFWFRWLPVPRALDEPFSTARWTLIAVHVVLVVAGVATVFFSSVV